MDKEKNLRERISYILKRWQFAKLTFANRLILLEELLTAIDEKKIARRVVDKFFAWEFSGAEERRIHNRFLLWLNREEDGSANYS